MYYSQQGFAESILTLPAGSGAKCGYPAALDSAGEAVCADGAFCGVITGLRGGAAAVQLGGVVCLPCSGTLPEPGYRTLAADGAGGVCASDSGREYLVLSAGSGEISFLL